MDRLTATSVHPSWIMFFMSMFTSTLGTPSAWIKVPSTLKPKFPNLFRARWNPYKCFACATTLLARNSNTAS